jgi:hypothetical protein
LKIKFKILLFYPNIFLIKLRYNPHQKQLKFKQEFSDMCAKHMINRRKCVSVQVEESRIKNYLGVNIWPYNKLFEHTILDLLGKFRRKICDFFLFLLLLHAVFNNKSICIIRVRNFCARSQDGARVMLYEIKNTQFNLRSSKYLYRIVEFFFLLHEKKTTH